MYTMCVHVHVHVIKDEGIRLNLRVSDRVQSSVLWYQECGMELQTSLTP